MLEASIRRTRELVAAANCRKSFHLIGNPITSFGRMMSRFLLQPLGNGCKRSFMIRTSYHKFASAIAIGSVLALLFITAPIWFPLMLAANAWERRQMRHAAKSFQCTICGRALDGQAIRVADKANERHMQEMRRKHPGIRFRTVRKVHAICTSCGANYRYVSENQSFVIVSRNGETTLS